MFDHTVLFTAGQGGYATYRIPCVAVTRAGTAIACCEARRTGRSDWDAIDLLMRRSPDGGRIWEPARPLGILDERVPKNPVALAQGIASADDQTYNNPVLITDDPAGAIHFLYCVEYARCFYQRSDDEGVTWSRPVEITGAFEAFRPEYDWKVLATGPGHGLRLRGGRLVVPVWLSTGTGGHAHRPSCVSVIVSDDGGRTWERGDIVVRHSEEIPNPSETVAAQLGDGRVMLNIRSESRRHRRLVSFSEDGAHGWSAPRFDEALFEPVCFASLLQVGGDLLFANPDSRDAPAGPNDWGAWPRENLTVRLSRDGGETWPVSRVLDPGVAGYSDLAAGPDGTLYCLYEGGTTDGTWYHNAYVAMARFDRAWLEAGACRPPAKR